jgi:hypothetical protein
VSFLRISLVELALASALLLGCGNTDSFDVGDSQESGEASDELMVAPRMPPSSTYYIARHDTRRCAFPMCGGVFVSAVNQALTRCPRGTYEEECYISTIDFSTFSLSRKTVAAVQDAIGYDQNTTRVVLLGTLHPTLLGYGTLRAEMAWVAVDSHRISGDFYEVRDSGIVCVVAPCPSFAQKFLNRGDDMLFHGLDLSDVPAHADDSTYTAPALRSVYGLIVSGENVVVEAAGPAGQALNLRASQAFIPATVVPGRIGGFERVPPAPPVPPRPDAQ